MKDYKRLFLVVLLILFIIVIVQFLSPVIGNILSSFLTTMATIIGFVTVFFEMKRAADIDECNFLLETYKHFTADSNSGISITFKKLDALFYENKNTFTKDDRKHIVEYLQFFEMLAGLIEKESLSIQDIDRLYGYSFFIATNCKIIQDIELIPYKDFYEGIFSVYNSWVKYRVMNNKMIPFNETPLIK